MIRALIVVTALALLPLVFDEAGGGKPPGEGQCAADGCKTYWTLTSVQGYSNTCGIAVDVSGALDETNVNGACNCNEQTHKCGAVEGTTCTPVVDLSVTVTASSGSYVFCEDGYGWSGARNTRSMTLAGEQVACNSGTGSGSYADEWVYLYVQCGTSCSPPLTAGRVAFVMIGHIVCSACAHYNYSCEQEPI